MTTTAKMFIPTANDRCSLDAALGFQEGPLCECGRQKCGLLLPKAAWMFVSVPGQYVVSPEHRTPEVESYDLDDFIVEKDDGETKRLETKRL